jgi:Calcineurin-like phosphoesterase
MAKKAKRSKMPARKPPVSRFSQPFFTATPPSRDPTMDLSETIGQPGVDEIKATGAIRFHAVGDTGRPGGDASEQGHINDAMKDDYDPAAGGRNPALFIHLGDVIYGHDKAILYRDEFYRPYTTYPGKIIAIPGNHDGETFPQTDPCHCRKLNPTSKWSRIG